jgi:hypothetical protein
MSLFFTNVCKFNNCGLYFASMYDLIQHIEETHVPLASSTTASGNFFDIDKLETLFFS